MKRQIKQATARNSDDDSPHLIDEWDAELDAILEVFWSSQDKLGAYITALTKKDKELDLKPDMELESKTNAEAEAES